MGDDGIENLAKLVEGGRILSYEMSMGDLAVTFSTASGECCTVVFLRKSGLSELGLGPVGTVTRVSADGHPVALGMLAQVGFAPYPPLGEFLYTLLSPCGVPLMRIVAETHSVLEPASEGESPHG